MFVHLSKGPALYTYNNAEFTDEDWEGIQNVARSVKRDDPNKVGRFGLGFNSVYHITGNCWNLIPHYNCFFICYTIAVTLPCILGCSALTLGSVEPGYGYNIHCEG